MKNATIAIWPFTTTPVGYQVIVAPSNLLADVYEHQKHGLIPRDIHVIEVKSSDPIEIETLARWLSTRCFGEPSIATPSADCELFFSRIGELLASPLVAKVGALGDLTLSAPRGVARVLDLFDRLPDVYDAFSRDGPLAHIAFDGILTDLQPSSVAVNFTLRESNLLKRARVARDALLYIFKACGACRPQLDAIGCLVEILEGVDVDVSARRYQWLTNLFMVASKLQLLVGYSTLAILSAHRALDSFLHSLCFEFQLLKRTGQGPRFTNDRWSDRLPSVAECHRALRESGRLVVASDTRDKIRACNRIRNHSYFTHDFFGASLPYAERFHVEILKIIKALDPQSHASLESRTSCFEDALSTLPMQPFALCTDIDGFLPQAATVLRLYSKSA